MEVKDVQKTEYLDKNGLNMLWAKVKQNTLNQVEAERNRAITQETRIIETKADKSTLDNYVSDTALKALEKKVSANTAAISNKQDAGNYLHCEPLNNEGYYEIPDVCISGSDGSTKTNIDSQSVSVIEDNGITASHNSMVLTASKLAMSQDVGDNTLLITTSGIANTDNNADHVYATDGSIADLTQYAKKAELPTAATKESLGVVKVGDGLNVTDGTISVDSTAICSGNYIPYNKADNVFYYLYNVGIISQREDGSSKTIQSPVFFEQSDENHSVTIRNGYINISNTRGNIMTLNKYDKDGGIVIYKQLNNSIKESLRILEDGIRLMGGDDNHVLTSNASTIDITQYALKSELPTIPTKVSQLTNDSNFITAADVDLTPYATTEALQAETTARTEANAALENKIAAKQDKITPKTIGNYQVGSEDESLTTDNIKALRALVLDLKSVLVQSGLIVNSEV